MWEGQATNRNVQVIAGIILGLVALPFLLLGSVGLFLSLFRGDPKVEIILVGAVGFLTGLLCFTLSYRLIWARGVKQGGGILSPIAFKTGGYIFIALSVFIAFQTTKNLNYTSIIGPAMSLFIAYMFFVAARHRGAMRKIK